MKCLLSGKFAVAVIAVSLVVASNTAAKADLQTIRSADNAIWGSVGEALFNYKEPSTLPNLPDSEHGWLPSVAAGFSFLQPSNLYVAFEGSSSFGEANYNGAYFSNPTMPAKGTTDESTFDIDGKVGQAFAMNNYVVLIPYGEAGFRYWNRDLGQGQVEKYQHFSLLAGLLAQFSPNERFVFSGYGSAGTTLSPQLEASGDTYKLGGSGLYKFGAKVAFNVTPRTDVFTSMDYDYFRYGKSGVIHGAYEPNSHTEETTWRVGVGYHFK